MSISRISSSGFLLLLCCQPLLAESTSFPVRLDRWMYPFNATPGSRVIGSTFGAIGNPGFDDHDAQILLGFDTSAAGQRAASDYQINSAVVTLTTAADNSFEYDSSYDALGTYLDDTTDTDTGRPIELYGIGFRNGYLSGSVNDPVAGPPVFGENDPFSIPGPPASEARFAFASDYSGGAPRDISNSVRNGMDLSPWAVGQTDAVAAGSLVPINSEFKFSIDLGNPDAVSYLQNGLSSGEVLLSVVSMHTSTQGSAAGIPSFHLGDSNGQSIGATARFDIDYSVVPEPCTGMIIASGIAAVALTARRHGR